MRNPHYCCGDPDGVATDRREAANQQLARMEECEHPDHWREPIRGLVGDGSCALCGASAQRIERHLRERRRRAQQFVEWLE